MLKSTSTDSLTRAPGSRFREAVASACYPSESWSEYQARKGDSRSPPGSRGLTPPGSRCLTPPGSRALTPPGSRALTPPHAHATARNSASTPRRGHREAARLRGCFTTPPRGVSASQTPQSIRRQRQARVLFDSSSIVKSPEQPWTPCSFSSVSCLQPKGNDGGQGDGDREDETLEMLQLTSGNWGPEPANAAGLDCRLHDLEAAVRALQQALPHDTSNFSSTVHLDRSRSQVGMNSSRDHRLSLEDKEKLANKSNNSCKDKWSEDFCEAVLDVEARLGVCANVTSMIKDAEETSKVRNGVVLQLVEELQTRLTTIDNAVLQLGQDLVSHVEQCSLTAASGEDSKVQIEELQRWRKGVDDILTVLQKGEVSDPVITKIPQQLEQLEQLVKTKIPEHPVRTESSSGVDLKEVHLWQERTDDLLKVLQKEVTEAVVASQSALAQSSAQQIMHSEQSSETDSKKCFDDLYRKQQHIEDLMQELQVKFSGAGVARCQELDELLQWRRTTDDFVRVVQKEMTDAAVLAGERFQESHQWRQTMDDIVRVVQKALSDDGERFKEIHQWQVKADGKLQDLTANVMDAGSAARGALAKVESRSVPMAPRSLPCSPSKALRVVDPAALAETNLRLEEVYRWQHRTDDLLGVLHQWQRNTEDILGTLQKEVSQLDPQGGFSAKQATVPTAKPPPAPDTSNIPPLPKPPTDEPKVVRTASVEATADSSGKPPTMSDVDLLATEQRLLEVKSKLLKWGAPEGHSGSSTDTLFEKSTTPQRRATSLGSVPKRTSLSSVPMEAKLMQVDDSVILLRQTVEQDRLHLSSQLQCLRHEFSEKLEVLNKATSVQPLSDAARGSSSSDDLNNELDRSSDSGVEKLKIAEARLVHLNKSFTGLENDQAEIRSAFAKVEARLESKTCDAEARLESKTCDAEAQHTMDSEKRFESQLTSLRSGLDESEKERRRIAQELWSSLKAVSCNHTQIEEVVRSLEEHDDAHKECLEHLQDEVRALQSQSSNNSVNVDQSAECRQSSQAPEALHEVVQRLATLEADNGGLRENLVNALSRHHEQEESIVRLSEEQRNCSCAEVSLSRRVNEMEAAFQEKQAKHASSASGEHEQNAAYRELAERQESAVQRRDEVAKTHAEAVRKFSKSTDRSSSDSDSSSSSDRNSISRVLLARRVTEIEEAMVREEQQRDALTQEMQRLMAVQQSYATDSKMDLRPETQRLLAEECTQRAVIDVRAELQQLVSSEAQTAAQVEVQLGLARVQSDLQVTTFDVGGLREAVNRLETTCENVEQASAEQELQIHELGQSKKGGGFGAMLCGRTKRKPPSGPAGRSGA